MPRQKLKQRPDGRYLCVYKDICFYGKTAAEALRKREDYIRSARLAEQNKRPLTVAEYAARWLPDHKSTCGTKTYNDYARLLEKMISLIGDVPIKDVTPSDVKRVYNLYKDMSQSTIHRAAMIYVSMYDAAVEDGYALRNPCRSSQAKPHRGTVGTHRVITEEERALIENTPHRMRLMAMTMLYAGLRRGEALALDVGRDVDFSAGTVTVREAVRYDGNLPILDAPKTNAGKRTIPLFTPLRTALTGRNGLLLESRQGGHASETTFSRGWENYMTVLSRAAGHPVSIRCHDLRHTFCTMLRDNGVEMKLAMQWMGHADEKMIVRIYDHVTDARVENAVESVEKSLVTSQNASQQSAKSLRRK